MTFLAIAALFIAGVLATPTTVDKPITVDTPTTFEEHWANIMTSDGKGCPDGLFSNAKCCAGDILGIIGLDCTTPIHEVRDARGFREECSHYGQQARCCVLPILGRALLCQSPVGAN